MKVSIAIDGPAGAGKSSVSRAVAHKLGYLYVDTGALYRTVAYAVLQAGLTAQQSCEIAKLLECTEVKLVHKNGEQCVLLNGEDVSSKIRTPEISMMASTVSALPQVRSFLLETQRNIAKENDIVMDGRDIGTVVLPNAQVKIFLTASDEVRANRRYTELIEKGQTADYEEVLQDIRKRDYQDTHREIAPLRCAPDAVELDTSETTCLEDSVRLVLETVSRELHLQEELQ